jgi:transposase-like protein
MCNPSSPIFRDADKARERLERLRWPDGPVCPHCGNKGAWAIETRPGLYKCAQYKCRKQFTVTVGTVFERSKISLDKWLMAVYLMCSSKKGVSSHQMHRTLGVTYKTALFMTHRIRLAMEDNSDTPMGSGGGAVEADETMIGAKRQKLAQGTNAHKLTILSLVERGGRVKSFPVPDVRADTLKPILEKHISSNARLMTDGGGQYRKIGKAYAEHNTVDHSHGEYARGNVHVNTLESYFGVMKRGINGVYQHVSQQHLHRYCAEFDHRFRYRTANGYTDMERTQLALKGIEGKRLM